MTHALRRAGWGPINHKRVLRVMREESLLCQLKRRFVVTTNSAHGYRTYPNPLKGTTLDRLDQAWVGDLTYIRPWSRPGCVVTPIFSSWRFPQM